MLGKVVDVFIMLILAIEVLAIVLSIIVIVKSITLTISQVSNTSYSARLCINDNTPLKITLKMSSNETSINPGQYGCLTVNSTQLPNNITLGLDLFNITLGVKYASQG